jgi:dCMP deaminase
MKDKHIRLRVEQCLVLAKASNCPRRKFGAIIFDPERNVDIISGYNGGPRGGGDLCGVGDKYGMPVCEREAQKIASGTQVEIGCHHAEMNAICNAAANGTSTRGAHMVVTGEPCLMCAKLIHHAGIVKVYVVKEGYKGANGIDYLHQHGVTAVLVDGPKDPRSP